uniref:Stabilizer of axonemal microtubules 2 n=1 Tax=Mesocestoides corti TaxID=53468 RepID=A0A5K3EHU0_MESCO
MSEELIEPNTSCCMPYCNNASPIYPAHLIRPKCDRYGCLIPLRPKQSIRRDHPKTKLGYDACQMPMAQRQRCPCCMYKEVPDLCCKRVSKFPNPCNYELMDQHHKRIYGKYMSRFDGVCRF